MRNWLRHNILGVALVAAGALTYGATVGYPAWKEGLGSDIPAATVPAGATVRIDGVLWRMRALEMPSPEYTRYDDPQPPGTRFVAYAFDRSKDRRAAPLGEEWGACRATFVDQN